LWSNEMYPYKTVVGVILVIYAKNIHNSIPSLLKTTIWLATQRS